MSNRSFLYLSIFTLILLMTALVSNLLQPKFETTINKGNLVFNNLKKDLNNVTQIKINNGLQEIIISKNNSDWNMQTKHGYKVKEDFVKERLIQTSELRFFEKKTKDKFLYSRLDLDYPENEEGNSN